MAIFCGDAAALAAGWAIAIRAFVGEGALPADRRELGHERESSSR